MTTRTLLLSVGVSDGGAGPRDRWWDLAVDGAAPLADLLPAVLLACGRSADTRWSVLDGDRILELAGPGLAAQGVVSGARLVLRALGPAICDRPRRPW
jgi:hypothetical protein